MLEISVWPIPHVTPEIASLPVPLIKVSSPQTLPPIGFHKTFISVTESNLDVTVQTGLASLGELHR